MSMTNTTFAVEIYKPLTVRCGSALKILIRKKSGLYARVIFETGAIYGLDLLPRRTHRLKQLSAHHTNGRTNAFNLKNLAVTHT